MSSVARFLSSLFPLSDALVASYPSLINDINLLTTMSANTSSRNPLYLLAQVASEATPASRYSSPSLESLDSPCSASSSCSETYISFTERPHIPCTVSRSLRPPIPSTRAEPNFVPYIVRPKRRSRKTELDIKTRLQMKARRKELMDKANRIKSLENSPVNDRQLSVLRMIYDEITMYPCESWMVLVAIIISR